MMQRCNSENNREENNEKINQVFYPDVFHPSTYAEYSKAGKDNMHSFADGYFLDFNTPVDLRNENGTLVCKDMLANFKWNAWNFGKMNELNPCLEVTFAPGGIVDKLQGDDTAPWELGPYLALHNMYGFKHAEMVSRVAILLV